MFYVCEKCASRYLITRGQAMAENVNCSPYFFLHGHITSLYFSGSLIQVAVAMGLSSGLFLMEML